MMYIDDPAHHPITVDWDLNDLDDLSVDYPSVVICLYEMICLTCELLSLITTI